MRCKSTKEKNRSSVIHQGPFTILRYSPNTEKFDLAERDLFYDNRKFYRKAELIPEEKEEINLSDLSKNALLLYELYMKVSEDNTIILSDRQASNHLFCSVSTVERSKRELKKLNIIRCLYDKKIKQFVIKLLPSENEV